MTKRHCDDHLVTITEFARLQGISTDRLRHYDKIGLFKPAWRDPETGLRYYSLSSSEDTLSTIVELRQLDMSLKEIGDYLEGRNLKKSLEVFESKQRELAQQIKEMRQLKRVVDEKVEFLKQVATKHYDFNRIEIKHLEQRTILACQALCHTDEECNLQAIQLQSALAGSAALTGTDRFTLSFSPHQADDGAFDIRVGIALPNDAADNALEQNTPTAQLEYLDEADYVCVYRWGDPYNVTEAIAQLRTHGEQLGLTLAEEAIETFEIDQSVTDIPQERIYELQIKVVA